MEFTQKLRSMDFLCLSIVIDGVDSEIKETLISASLFSFGLTSFSGFGFFREVIMGKGWLRRVEEQNETRNFALYDDICKIEYGRPKGFEDHFKKEHARNGFICTNCKKGVLLADSSLHGEGVCEKLPNIKKKKETKKEKKMKKKAAKEVGGYLEECFS